MAARSGKKGVPCRGGSPASSHIERCHSLRSRRDFQFTEEVGRQNCRVKGGQHRIEGGAQRRGTSLENTLDPRGDVVTVSPTYRINAGKFLNLNIKNSKRKVLKALRNQGLSIVTANPSEFGLKGVNSPLL